VTPFAVLMSGLLVQLRRASGQSEFIIGTPAAGRTRAEWQDVAGCFVNVVPVLARLAGSMTGADLVAHAGAATWQALEAQDVPFDRLVRALGRRAVPLVIVLFSYQPHPLRVPFPGLVDAAPIISSPPGTAKYDLSLYAVGRGADLRLELEYDTDLYARGTAAAVLATYRDTLHSLVREPDRVLDLPAPSGFESAAERTRERSAGLDRAAS
jgi:non-ribosomal peptide synthetase component F